MRILVVEDKKAVRAAMVKILKELGFEKITEAPEGRDAWFKLKAEFQDKEPDVYDLIICDQEMPEMSGLELLKKVRMDKALSETPFIMVTAVNDKSTILAIMKLGIKAYIIKPFNTESVAAKLTQAGFLPEVL